MFGLKTKLFGGEPRTYRQETGSAWGAYKTSNAAGLVAGTRVATTMGWRPVEAVAEGDLVLTFDRGMQPVRAITRSRHWDSAHPCPKALLPLNVPAGALGNQSDMTLLPEQCVMIESDSGDMLFGDPFTLVHAADLAGLRGIERGHPRAPIEIVQLHFDDDEVVFANNGALALCPSLSVMNIEELLAQRPDALRYEPLTSDMARMLVDCLAEEDAVSRHGDAEEARHAVFV